MNKAELIAAVAEKQGVAKTAAGASVEAVIAAIADALKAGEKVQLVGFGTFEVKDRPARQGQNPKTGEKIAIAASKAPVFKAGKTLKDAVK
ncbi:MAG: HU family DNA-binding protein [Oscillospiraceae bacterium]|jgi:DNA-binding protein HU-beta|nr:HU family DNA-binding protein [Oscillospiraceae bacterium]